MTKKGITIIEKEILKKSGVLNLSDCQLEEIPAELLEMGWLTELHLFDNKITEIKNIDALTQLIILDVSYNHIDEIINLAHLTKLQKLYLGNNSINEIKNLQNLQSLETLDLNNNEITEIKNLDALQTLLILDLGYNKISEIKNLNRLNQLTDLLLYGNKITIIKNLFKLQNLQKLTLTNNPITDVSLLPQLIKSDKLVHLNLAGITTNNLNIPVEIFGKGNEADNSLQALKGYFASLKKGQFELKELPVILVGNSTSGKTSLRYFLQQNIFPPPNNCSTHGIEPSIWLPDEESLKNLDEDIKPKDLQLFFWDFGGQEYYHATHRLFFSKRAIYIVVWEQKTNKQSIEDTPVRIRKPNGVIEESIFPVELFPYEYWLQSIRHLAPNAKESPVILLQNKMDEAGNNIRENPDPVLLERIKAQVLQLSVKRAYELNGKGRKDPLVDVLLEQIFSAAKAVAATITYGAIWVDIKKMLQDVRGENVWTRERFLNELRVFDKDVSEDSLVSYLLSLSASGDIIYQYNDPFLEDFIFINPGWVTTIIYEILDRSVWENKGSFNKAHVVNKAGAQYSDAFIALMKKFDLVFEYVETYQNKQFVNYVAPQYLPPELTDINKGIELDVEFDGFEKPGFILQFKEFLPRYIMLRFLAAFGEKAISKYYWKNGIAFTLEKSRLVLLSDYDKKQFRVFTNDNNGYIKRQVFDKLVELSENVKSLEICSGINDFVDYTALIEEFPNGKSSGNNNIKAASGQRVPLNAFNDLFENITVVKNRYDNQPKEAISIFISYAHVDTATKELFEGTYLKAIQNYYGQQITVWTDKKIRPGSMWDTAIKNQLNAADIILFFLSNSMLASNYIKDVEIKAALERYQQKNQIIVPVYVERIATALLPFPDRQYLPGGTPITDWNRQNDAWVKVQEGIIEIIKDIRAGNANLYFE
ncbi:MAG: COR domain-containing protein [Ferruginibacter sp.]